MIRLTLASVARLRGGMIATGLVALCGAALLAAMAGVLATGLASSTADADRGFLVQFPAILGSWILAIVVFAVVSTVGVALDGRAGEIKGLRLAGATPHQVQALVAGESALVATAGGVVGAGAGVALGIGVIAAASSTGVIESTEYAPGIIAPLVAVGLVVVATTLGAAFGSRRAARRSPVADAETADRQAAPHVRRVSAVILLLVGIGSSSAALAMDPASVLPTAATGPGCVLVALGAALLARELLQLADRTLLALLRRAGSAASRTAGLNLRAAPHRIAPAITFLTVLVGVTAGTLSMQSIESSSGVTGGIGALMGAINILVVILIVAFMSIALVNGLIAAIGHRHGELDVMRSIGATRRQSTVILLIETTVALVIACVAGVVGAVVAVAPFAILKTGSIAAAIQVGPIALAVVLAAVLGLATTTLAARRTLASAAA